MPVFVAAGVGVAAPKRPPPVVACGLAVVAAPKSPVPAGLAPKRPPVVAILLGVVGFADALPEPNSPLVAAGCAVPLWRV